MASQESSCPEFRVTHSTMARADALPTLTTFPPLAENAMTSLESYQPPYVGTDGEEAVLPCVDLSRPHSCTRSLYDAQFRTTFAIDKSIYLQLQDSCLRKRRLRSYCLGSFH
ncbi:hypothetical protein Tcan_00084 [Toxocara canis]|uniref:Uncharacterized protein n=1 Tax=Toxocara canis TaxID=6265 RepID=A0A0B2VH47_TOXCA|nr:hypothetical protein Tcan_00084 [Toxocara canis]